jgi:hypothetical protein
VVVALTRLIVYATPTQAFADACRVFDDAARAIAPTAAQRYPAHCSLTGFFRRDGGDIPRIVDEVADAFPGGTVDPTSVGVAGPVRHDSWLGFELTSPSLITSTERFARRHVVGNGDDAIRVKSWLHLSLAYDVGDLGPYLAAAETIDWTVAPSAWSIGLWEWDDGGEWTRHT